MPKQTTALDRLIEELETVTEHFMIQRYSSGDYVIATFVTADHTGPDVLPVACSNNRVNIDGSGPTMESALDDVLGKIALAAPQTTPVSA